MKDEKELLTDEIIFDKILRIRSVNVIFGTVPERLVGNDFTINNK